jgi:FkbM family methyltransferase
MRFARLARIRQVIIPPLRASGLRHVIIPPLRAYFRYFPISAGKPFVWNYIAAHLWWLESRVRSTTRFGAVLDVDGRDCVGRFVYYFGVWEPHLTGFIRGRLQPGDCFVDVGANIGYFATLASRLVGTSGRVVAIEAIPKTFKVLMGNLARTGVKNVRGVNLAAWDKVETLTFFISPDTIDGTSTVVQSMAERNHLATLCEISAAPLSSLLEADEIARARVIKIDVEGAERHLLHDLAAILGRGRKDLEIVMEVSAEAFDEIVGFFHARGFHPYQLKNDYSPTSYIYGSDDVSAKRLHALAEGETQVDLVFSRMDSTALNF